MAVFINENITHLKESSTLKINQLAKTKRANGETIYHFGFGQSPFPVHPKIVQALQQNAHQKDYLSTLGLPELRQQISRYYKKHFNYQLDPERIIVGPGTKELLFQALYALEGPVIIPAPSWVSYGPMLELRGKKFSPITTRAENNFKLTAKELEQTCKGLTAQQKILILTNPNNPTGSVYHSQEIEQLSEVCRKNNIIVLSDEIYSLVDFDGHFKQSFHHYYPEGTIITSGLSKSHGAGGWRLGFLAAPKELQALIDGLCAMVSETFSAVCTPVQYAGICAYSDDHEIQAQIELSTAIHREAGRYLYHRLTKMGLDSSYPEGAFYLFCDFKNFKQKLNNKYQITTANELTNTLLREAKVATLPGSDFYYPEEQLCCRLASVDYQGEALLKKAQNQKAIDQDFIQQNCPMLTAGADALENFVKNL